METEVQLLRSRCQDPMFRNQRAMVLNNFPLPMRPYLGMVYQNIKRSNEWFPIGILLLVKGLLCTETP
jgi:hypothetical protein